MPDVKRYRIKESAKAVRALLDISHPTVRPRCFDPSELDFASADPKKLVAYSKYRLSHLPMGLVASAYQYAVVCGLLLRAGLITRNDLPAAGLD